MKDKSKLSDPTPRLERIARLPKGRERLREVAAHPVTSREFAQMAREVLSRVNL